MRGGYQGVHFDFVNIDEAQEATGSVAVSADGMVLDIPIPGKSPYVVVGKAQDAVFRGIHLGPPGDVSVQAVWTRLGGIWVGRWIEEGTEYLFRFSLPNQDDSQRKKGPVITPADTVAARRGPTKTTAEPQRRVKLSATKKELEQMATDLLRQGGHHKTRKNPWARSRLVQAGLFERNPRRH